LLQSLFRKPKSDGYVRPAVPKLHDYSEVDYVLAIDDTGKIDPLLTKRGEPKLADNALVMLACFGLPVEYIEDFNNDWTDLREAIREELRLAVAPPIHLRLMHGPRVPPKNRGKPNPYYGVPIETRHEWIKDASLILSYYSYLDIPYFESHFFAGRGKMLEDFIEVMTQCKLWDDLKALEGRKSRKALKLMSQRLSSPLPPLIALMVSLIDKSMEYLGSKRALILFDPFDDSQGVAEDTVQKIINDTAKLKNVTRMDRVVNSDDIPLAQAADLYAFSLRRVYESIEGRVESDFDLGLLPLFLKTPRPIWQADRDWDKEPFATDLRARLVIQYAIFKESLKTLDPIFYDQIVDAQEFSKRVDVNRATGARVSVFK